MARRDPLRLEATQAGTVGAAARQCDPPDSMAYRNAGELQADVQLVADTLRDSGHKTLADGLVQEWLDRIAVLGFHTAELDIREDSGRLASMVQELAAELGLCIDFEGLREDRKQAFLLAPPPLDVVRRLAPERLSPSARETLDLFRLLARTVANYGHAVDWRLDREHDPSRQRCPEPWSGSADWARPAKALHHVPLPTMPLLETIDDLQRAEGILRDMFAHAGYKSYLEELGSNQACMIGYSDSVKDGGYIAANWQLYDSQRRLARLAKEFNVSISFFHGRGGALGAAAVPRPGGPFLARGIGSRTAAGNRARRSRRRALRRPPGGPSPP